MNTKKSSHPLILIICIVMLLFPFTQSFAEQIPLSPAKQTYVVAYSPTHSPFTYTNTQGEAAGIAIGIMDAIAEKGGFQVSYVSINDYHAPIDLNLSLFTNDQLEDHSQYSSAYAVFPIIAIGKTSDTVNPTPIVGHLDYVFIEELHLSNYKGPFNTVKYTSYAEMEEDFESGALDYVLVSSLVAQGLIQNDKSTTDNLTPLLNQLPVSISFSENLSQTEITSINKIIENLNPGEVQSIMLNEAANIENVRPLGETLLYYRREILIVALLLLTLCIGSALIRAYKKKKDLLHSMEIDALTGLDSELGFIRKAERVLEEKMIDFSIVSVDIDNFKHINELYGYTTGTEVIIAVGAHFKKEFTTAEALARIYGDHFLILVPQCTLENGMTICGKSHCLGCSKHILDDILGENYNLDMSIGIYNITDKSTPLTYMIDCANNARSRGKSTYGRTYAVFSKAQEDRLKQTNTIIHSMEKGIANKEFKMYYQPKVDLKSGKIVGGEALVRWFKEDGRQVYPDEFIPLFEKNGFITRLDYYVFETVCEFLSKHPELPKISVNLSGVTLMDEQLLAKLFSITNKYNIDPLRMELELTETALVEKFDKAIGKIVLLKEQGFTISMDDFGAGVSSLNRLNEIYIDILKIDKEFLRDSLIGLRGAAIIESIIGLAKRLQIAVVAEGVETAQQVEFLQNLGCDMAQGYYYARPLSGDDFLKQLEK